VNAQLNIVDYRWVRSVSWLSDVVCEQWGNGRWSIPANVCRNVWTLRFLHQYTTERRENLPGMNGCNALCTVGWVIWPVKSFPKWSIMCWVGH